MRSRHLEKVLLSNREWLMDLWEAQAKAEIADALDQRLLRSNGRLERNGWIYCIRKGLMGCSILAFEFF